RSGQGGRRFAERGDSFSKKGVTLRRLDGERSRPLQRNVKRTISRKRRTSFPARIGPPAAYGPNPTFFLGLSSPVGWFRTSGPVFSTETMTPQSYSPSNKQMGSSFTLGARTSLCPDVLRSRPVLQAVARRARRRKAMTTVPSATRYQRPSPV